MTFPLKKYSSENDGYFFIILLTYGVPYDIIDNVRR
nr:MAG TPA: hypothetical protein [Caudoviricetes sp.]